MFLKYCLIAIFCISVSISAIQANAGENVLLKPGESLTLDGSNSLASSGIPIVQYLWDLNGDDVYDLAVANPVVTVTWTELEKYGFKNNADHQEYPITLCVQDRNNQRNICKFSVYTLVKPIQVMGIVRNVVNNLPLMAKITIWVYYADESDCVLLRPITSNADGMFQIKHIPQGKFKLLIQSAGFQDVVHISIASDYYGSEIRLNTSYLVPSNSTPGTIQGFVDDATNAKKLENVQIKCYRGINTHLLDDLEPVAHTKTDAQGCFVFANLPIGNYTLVAQDLARRTVPYLDNWLHVISCSEVGIEQNISLSNMQGEVDPRHGKYRIILRWGKVPSDLDSHLIGPSATGTFHVFYGYKIHEGDKFQLDRDDTTSYGPETTTITYLYPGEYTFSIHNYSESSSTSTTALSNSGVYIQVFDETNHEYVFYPRPNIGATVWKVFKIVGNRIVFVDEYYYGPVR